MWIAAFNIVSHVGTVIGVLSDVRDGADITMVADVVIIDVLVIAMVIGVSVGVCVSMSADVEIIVTIPSAIGATFAPLVSCGVDSLPGVVTSAGFDMLSDVNVTGSAVVMTAFEFARPVPL